VVATAGACVTEEALSNLKEALELYFEGEAPRVIHPAVVKTVELSAR
jgi:predicted RNase H-like HicB family nuclease